MKILKFFTIIFGCFLTCSSALGSNVYYFDYESDFWQDLTKTEPYFCYNRVGCTVNVAKMLYDEGIFLESSTVLNSAIELGSCKYYLYLGASGTNADGFQDHEIPASKAYKVYIEFIINQGYDDKVVATKTIDVANDGYKLFSGVIPTIQTTIPAGTTFKFRAISNRPLWGSTEDYAYIFMGYDDKVKKMSYIEILASGGIPYIPPKGLNPGATILLLNKK